MFIQDIILRTDFTITETIQYECTIIYVVPKFFDSSKLTQNETIHTHSTKAGRVERVKELVY